VFDACNIYPCQARTNANDKKIAKDYILFTKHHAQRKILKYKQCRVVDSSKKVLDFNCEVHDLLLEALDLRSCGIPPQFNQTVPAAGLPAAVARRSAANASSVTLTNDAAS